MVGKSQMFTIVLQCLHLRGEIHSLRTTQKQANDEISIHVVDQILQR